MFGIHNLGLFLAIGTLFNLTRARQGLHPVVQHCARPRCCCPSALEVVVGSVLRNLCHGALGFRRFSQASAFAFVAIKLLGGAYVILLGIKMLLEIEFSRAQKASEFRRDSEVN